MNITNPIGKHIKIVPSGGGLVKSGKLLQLTTSYATILNDEGKEQSINLKGENLSLTDNQIIQDIEDSLTYKLKPEGKTLLKEILRAHKNILNRY